MQNSIQNGISSPVVSSQANPDLGYKDIFYQLEQIIGADVERVNGLVRQGVLNQKQGEYLLNQLAQKAKLIESYKLAGQNTLAQSTQVPTEQAEVQPVPEIDHMALFNKERPGFFDAAGRGDILNYIKGFDMDKDEILRISQLVEGLENSAVENYLKKSSYEKALNDENALAKSKLTAYAQNSASEGNFSKVFTKEDIGRMSGDEFTANEKTIMQQLRQGLIK